MLVLFLLVVVMIMPACQPSTTEAPGEVQEVEDEPVVDASDMSFAMVTDQAGLGDQAFNDATWEGFTALNEDYGVLRPMSRPSMCPISARWPSRAKT